MTRSDLRAPVDEMEEIVSMVLDTMLGLEATPLEADWTPRAETMLATVHMTGRWSGAILLETTKRQACFFAGLFLTLDPPERVDNDVRDVLGELVNMIAGNLKSMIAPGAMLSMPSVVDGSDYTLRICSGTEVRRQAFLCEGDVIWLSRITAPQQAA